MTAASSLPLLLALPLLGWCKFTGTATSLSVSGDGRGVLAEAAAFSGPAAEHVLLPDGRGVSRAADLRPVGPVVGAYRATYTAEPPSAGLATVHLELDAETAGPGHLRPTADTPEEPLPPGPGPRRIELRRDATAPPIALAGPFRGASQVALTGATGLLDCEGEPARTLDGVPLAWQRSAGEGDGRVGHILLSGTRLSLEEAAPSEGGGWARGRLTETPAARPRFHWHTPGGGLLLLAVAVLLWRYCSGNCGGASGVAGPGGRQTAG